MWLLHAASKCLVNFMGDAPEPYAILSHTWERDEVSFTDIQNVAVAKNKEGFRKVEFACKQALEDGYQYVWIDTCCINKDSTSELSEAINSMYRWYYNAKICYAYLSDAVMSDNEWDLENCRWFTRGWTLQETIAPSSLTLYGHDWRLIGTRFELCTELSRITNIEIQLLKRRANLHHYCMAQRLAWASRRHTTRIEDQAYCLLGLLDVNMPLLYGEGPKAFHRLQQEVLSNSDRDFSVLTWDPYHPRQISLVLAPDVYCFRNAAKTEVRPGPPQLWSASWTSNGLRAHLPVVRAADGKMCYIELQNTMRGRFLGLRKVQQPGDSHAGKVAVPGVYEIMRNSTDHSEYLSATPQPREAGAESEMQNIVLTGFRSWNYYVTLDISHDLQVLHAHPASQWYPETTDFAYSALLTDVVCMGAIVVNHQTFAEPKVFAFALTIPGEYISLAALAWYELPTAKVPNGLLSPTRVASQRSARYAKAAADAVLRIRKAYFNSESADSPLSSYSASKSTNILAKLVNEEAFKGKKFPVCLPKNQTVIKVWTADATKAEYDLEISDRTASRWAFEEDERYRQYDESLALG